jgi:hypothetical protein
MENRPSPDPFFFDLGALETGACLMLDVIAPRADKQWKQFQHDPIAKLQARIGDKELVEELAALQSLVREQMPKAQEPALSRRGVYVCWYSQLRDLLNRLREQAEQGVLGAPKDPSSNLRVCALPGWGFTGDWYIGVVDGSASIALGQELVEMLCSKKEEYQRLDQGVGLPTLEVFYDGGAFKAWPESQVPLRVLSDMHRKARSRAAIRNYQEIKPILYRAWRDLLAGQTPRQILGQLIAKMRTLVPAKPRIAV